MYLFRYRTLPAGILQTDFRFYIAPPPPLSLSLSLSLCLAFFFFLFPSSLARCASTACIARIHADGVSFRILAFDRVLGPVSLGVMIEREGYRALPLARPSIAHSTRFSRAARALAFAFAKSAAE